MLRSYAKSATCGTRGRTTPRRPYSQGDRPIARPQASGGRAAGRGRRCDHPKRTAPLNFHYLGQIG